MCESSLRQAILAGLIQSRSGDFQSPLLGGSLPLLREPPRLVDELQELTAISQGVLALPAQRQVTHHVPSEVTRMLRAAQQHAEAGHARGELEIARAVRQLLLLVRDRHFEQVALVTLGLLVAQL